VHCGVILTLAHAHALKGYLHAMSLGGAYGKAGNGNGKLKWKLLHSSV